MRNFMELVTDKILADQFAIEQQGLGAFKRFRTTLFDHSLQAQRVAKAASEHGSEV